MGSLPRRPDPRHTARPVKDRSTYPGSVATHEGVGARCHHTTRPRTPAPRPARACAACPPTRPGPATAVRQHRGLAGLTYGQRRRQSESSGGPGLDAGARWQYICKALQGGRKTAEGQWQAEQPRVSWQADACVGRTPGTARSAAPETDRCGIAADLQERRDWQNLRAGVVGAREISGTGRAQRRRCSRCAPRWGARTSPDSPAQGGGSPAAQCPCERGCTDRSADRCADRQYLVNHTCASLVGTPRRQRLGGVCDGAAVDDGGVGPRPAPPCCRSPMQWSSRRRRWCQLQWLSTCAGENSAPWRAKGGYQWGLSILPAGGACGGQRWGKACDTGTTRARPAVPCGCTVAAGG